MSSGPIQGERAARTTPDVSTPANARVCMHHRTRGTYCGRNSAKTRTTNWQTVVCADCVAAGRADGLKLQPIDQR